MARAALPVRPRVVLLERPQRRRVVADEHAVALPLVEHLGRVGVRVAVGLRQVDLDDVVRRAGEQVGALGGVDDVVRRRDDVLQAADAVEVVVEGAEGLDFGH